MAILVIPMVQQVLVPHTSISVWLLPAHLPALHAQSARHVSKESEVSVPLVLSGLDLLAALSVHLGPIQAHQTSQHASAALQAIPRAIKETAAFHVYQVNTQMGIAIAANPVLATQPCAPAFQAPALKTQVAAPTPLVSGWGLYVAPVMRDIRHTRTVVWILTSVNSLHCYARQPHLALTL